MGEVERKHEIQGAGGQSDHSRLGRQCDSVLRFCGSPSPVGPALVTAARAQPSFLAPALSLPCADLYHTEVHTVCLRVRI